MSAAEVMLDMWREVSSLALGRHEVGRGAGRRGILSRLCTCPCFLSMPGINEDERARSNIWRTPELQTLVSEIVGDELHHMNMHSNNMEEEEYPREPERRVVGTYLGTFHGWEPEWTTPDMQAGGEEADSAAGVKREPHVCIP